jgi:tRNA U55 pseudouridine synthase TruB
VEDIAEKLGTVATLAALEREAIGPYSLSAAVAGDNLRTMTSEELWQKVAS